MALTEQEELELLELEAEEAKARAAGKRASKPGPLESAGRGMAQGATVGFADEGAGIGASIKKYLTDKYGGDGPLAGVASAVKDAALGGVPAAAADFARSDPKIETYKEGRDKWRARDDSAQEENPLEFGAGNLAGAGLSMMIPGANVATAAKMAALGGMAGLGASEADLTEGNVKDAAIDSAGGAALGAGVGKAAQAAAPIAGKIAGKLKGAATKAARRAIGYSKRFLNKQGIERADDISRTMLDEGAIPWSGGAAETLRRIQDIADNSGAELGRVRKALDEMGIGGINTSNLTQKILSKKPAEVGGVFDDIARHVDKAADTVTATGPETSFGQAEKLKKLLYEAGGKTDDIQANTFRDASRVVREATEEKLDESAKMLNHMNPNRADKISYEDYLKNKKLYGMAADASDVALDKVNREAGNSFPSLRGTIAAGARLGTGDILGAAGTLGVTELAFRRGAGFSANATNKIADLVKQSPKVFGKFAPVLTNAMARSPQTFAVTHYLLGQQEPEYQEIVNNIGKEEANAD